MGSRMLYVQYDYNFFNVFLKRIRLGWEKLEGADVDKNILISANRVCALNIFCESAGFTANIYMNQIDIMQ